MVGGWGVKITQGLLSCISSHSYHHKLPLIRYFKQHNKILKLKTTQNLIFHSSEDQNCKMDVLAGPCFLSRMQGRILCLFLASDGCQQSLSLTFFGLSLYHSSLCLHSHMVFSMCVFVSKFPSSYDTNHWIRVHSKTL